jgi:hypothetical protein
MEADPIKAYNQNDPSSIAALRRDHFRYGLMVSRVT